MSISKFAALVRVGLFCCACLCLSNSQSALGLTINYIPGLDDSAMVYAQPTSGSPNCCGNANVNLTTGRPGTATYSGRAVFRFDDLATLSNDATIMNATLRLYRTSAPESNDGLQRLYVLDSPFTVVGLDPTVTSNTPNGDLWRLADGVAGAGSAMGTPFATFTAMMGYNNIDVTSVVQAWQANNWVDAYGFGLVGVEGSNSSGVTYGGALSANPLMLELEYTLPIPAPEPSSLLLASACLGLAALRRRANHALALRRAER